nr:MAG TPA: hypothetical protein [Inoviridae sp.]
MPIRWILKPMTAMSRRGKKSSKTTLKDIPSI